MDKNFLVKKPKAVKPSFVRNDDRGQFVEIVSEGPWETIIHGSMKKDKTMGNHYHRECRAFYYLINGKVRIQVRHLIDNNIGTITLNAGQGIYFLPFEVHSIYYLEDSNFVLLKSYRFDENNPDIFPDEINEP